MFCCPKKKILLGSSLSSYKDDLFRCLKLIDVAVTKKKEIDRCIYKDHTSGYNVVKGL